MSLDHEFRYCETCQRWHNVWHMAQTCNFPYMSTNPECDHLKHRNCDGTAWSDDTDSPTKCGCICHDTEEES